MFWIPQLSKWEDRFYLMPEEGKRFPVRSVPHTGLGFMLAVLCKELPGRSLPHINMRIQAVCFVIGCYEKKGFGNT